MLLVVGSQTCHIKVYSPNVLYTVIVIITLFNNFYSYYSYRYIRNKNSLGSPLLQPFPHWNDYISMFDKIGLLAILYSFAFYDHLDTVCTV